MDGGVDDGGVDGGPDGGTLDSDFDGVPDDEDPCSTTLANATQVTPGCSATDIIIEPSVLMESVADEIDEFLTIVSLPSDVVANLEEARIFLGDAVRDFQAMGPCEGAVGFEEMIDFMDGADKAMQDFLLDLNAAIPPTPAGVPDPGDVPPEASVYLWWTLHEAELDDLVDHVSEVSSIVGQICDQEMGIRMVSGVVQSVRDDLRVVQLRSGEVIVLGPNIVEEGEHRMGEGREVSIEGLQLSDVLLGTRITTMPSPYIIIPGLTYDGCLQLRMHLRPDIAGPEPLPLDGFFNDKGYYDFERGMSLGAVSRGCPTQEDLAGQGPGGIDMKIVYGYHLVLQYTNKNGYPWSRIMAFEHGSGDPLREPILIPPDVDPDIPATLFISHLKSTCVDSGQPRIPEIDPQSGNPGPAMIQWDCSNKETLEFDSPTVYFRDPGDYCDVGYDKGAFKLEDDEYSAWEPAMVQGMLVHGDLPLPVTFVATGPKIINGTPTPGETVGRNEPFAMYGSFRGAGQQRTGPGLFGAHITGTRNGQPFAHVCTLPSKVVRDGIDTGASVPCTFYRLPYPNGTSVHVNQGNGGTTSHQVNTSQQYALDLSGDEGNPLIAARGGKVARVVSNITENCGGCGEGDNPPCPSSCPAYGSHVIVQHQDNRYSFYMHMVAGTAAVLEGQTIPRGAAIGQLGNTGRSGGPHLHFQATAGKDDGWTVPIQYEIGGNCVIPAEGQTYTSSNEPN